MGAEKEFFSICTQFARSVFRNFIYFGTLKTAVSPTPRPTVYAHGAGRRVNRNPARSAAIDHFEWAPHTRPIDVPITPPPQPISLDIARTPNRQATGGFTDAYGAGRPRRGRSYHGRRWRQRSSRVWRPALPAPRATHSVPAFANLRLRLNRYCARVW